MLLHAVSQRIVPKFVLCIEVVDFVAVHVVNPDVDLPGEVFERESHIAIVRVRNDIEASWRDALLFVAIEGTYNPFIIISLFFAIEKQSV